MLFSQIVFGQNTIETAASLKSLIVYTSSAEMHFEKKIKLKKGENKITLTELTPYIVQNSISLQVSNPEVKIITVSEHLSFLKTIPNASKDYLQDSIIKIEDQLGIINTKIEVIETEKSILFKDESIGGLSRGVSVSEIEKASAFFSKRYGKLSSDLYSLNKQKSNLISLQEKLKNEYAQSKTGVTVTTSEVSVVLLSPQDMTININLNLMIEDAGWAPIYDVRYSGINNELDMVFRANIFNATGRSWENVGLKLSTANPMKGLQAPVLTRSKDEERATLKYKKQNIEFETVEVSNIIENYNIEYNYSIPSNGKPYLVDVDRYSIPSNFYYIIIPKMDNHGFLMANIPNWGKYNLMSGSANIFSNGIYLGKTFLKTITNNDTLSMYLGKDNNIETYRTEISKENDNKVIGNYYVDKTNMEISIKNNFNQNVSVLLIDQVPYYSEREFVKFYMSEVDDAIYQSKDGSLKWTLNLNPGEMFIKTYSYTVKLPKTGRHGKVVKPRRSCYRPIECPKF